MTRRTADDVARMAREEHDFREERRRLKRKQRLGQRPAEPDPSPIGRREFEQRGADE